MARYITENIPCKQKGVIVKMVFFSSDYKHKWLFTSEGKRTVVNTVMEQLALGWLHDNKPLDDKFFDDYIRISEQRMKVVLESNGKGAGAADRARRRMTELFGALRAVVVADILKGQLRVQCLNTERQVATYDPLTQTVSIENDHWNVAADLPIPKKPEIPGGTTGGTSGGTMGGTNGGGGQESEKPGDKKGGFLRFVFGGKQKDGGGKQKGGSLVIVFGNKGMTVERETSGLSSRNPIVRWWKKYRFGVIAFVFFFVLSASIVYGLLRLQKSIEALPNAPRTEQPAAPADSISPADSLQARHGAPGFLGSLDNLDSLDHLDHLDNLENLSPA